MEESLPGQNGQETDVSTSGLGLQLTSDTIDVVEERVPPL